MQALSDQELIERHIVPGPIEGHGASDARLADSGVYVWALIGYLQNAVPDDQAQEIADYDVSPEAMKAALAYYRRHTPVIDARIVLNRDAFGNVPSASDADLIDRFIEECPDSPGPLEARLAHSAVPVWSVVGYLKAMDHDIAAVAAGFDAEPEAIEAAWAYYRRHSQALDARLAANGV